MKAQDLKAEILGWLRYVRKQEIVCTEVGPWNADCWGLSETRLIEVETKVTLADLRADFRKPKHRAFVQGHAVPNLFYFAIPPDLEIPALKVLEERAADGLVAKYGLLVVTKVDGYLGRQTREVRKAERLHARPPADGHRRTALLRQSSEICGLHQALGYTQRRLDPVIADLAAAVRMVYTEADRVKLESTYKEDDDGTTGLDGRPETGST